MTPDLPAVEITIVEMTNAFRAQQGLPAVRREPRLDEAARRYARYLARTDTFSHSADGRQPADRVEEVGYDYCQVAENLALNLDSRGFRVRQLARSAVEGWKNSPGHRRNMLAKHATEIGVGVARRSGTQKYLSVQLFGRPRALRFDFEIRNEASQSVAYRLDDERHSIPPNVRVTHTICRPAELTFGVEGLIWGTRDITGTFEVQRGDLYAIRQTRSGGIAVRHQPAVN